MRTQGSQALAEDEKDDIEERLEDSFGWRARIPALFARLVADEIERERSAGRDLATLEISLADLVVSYVARAVANIPKDRAASLDPAQAWRPLGSLAWACLGVRLSVTPIARSAASDSLSQVAAAEGLLHSICDEARLAHRVANDRIVISSDALAEYLAALWIFDSQAGQRWTEEVEPRITQVLEARPLLQRIDEPTRTFLSALLDVAERSIGASTGVFEHVSAPDYAATQISQWLEVAADSKPPIKVGMLFSTSGAMAISEQQVQAATLLAIERVNLRGGVRGRRIVPVIRDGRSDSAQFAREAESLIDQGVRTIFGCWTSASRIEVLEVLEKKGGLLFYPVQYEGYESSLNALYFGAAPNQQLLPAVDWCIDAGFKRFLIVGSDYVFPRIASEILKARICERVSDGASLLHEPFYVDLAAPDFDPVFNAVHTQHPDVILNTINGAGNLEFFWRLWSMRRQQTGPSALGPRVMSFSVGDHEAQHIGIEVTAGHYAAWNYFSTLAGNANTAFLRGMRGRKQVFFPSDPAEAAYTQVLVFAKAAERVIDAGDQSLSPHAVRMAALGLAVDAPCGKVCVDPDNGHVFKVPRIAILGADGMFEVLWEASEAVKPDPYPYPALEAQVRKLRSQFHPQASPPLLTVPET